MIHVQIACDITACGVEGVRWVLLDPDEPPAPRATAHAAESPAPPEAGQPAAPVPEPPTAAVAAVTSMMQPMRGPPQPARTGLRIEAWQLVISGLGLVVVMGLAQRDLGSATRPWRAAAAAPAPTVPITPPSAAAPPTRALHVAATGATTPLAPAAGGAQALFSPLAPSETRRPAAEPVPGSLVPAMPAPAASRAPGERFVSEAH